MGRRRFTLLELLVVLVVIALLAAMLFFALNSARRAARRNQCVGVLKNYNQAGALYAVSYSDCWVPPQNPPWYSLLEFRRLVGAGAEPDGEAPLQSREDRFPRLLLCPDSLAVSGGGHFPYRSYGVTYRSLAGGRAFRISRLYAPSRSATWMDALGARVIYNERYDAEVLPGKKIERCAFRHGGSLNAGFFDGHVENLSCAEVSERWNNPEARFNIDFY
ncbi:MAG: prepilin-type N-terminal cleavage/methylation domain-containing protein [Lentisphaeria bacterium]|nr:prepilin-type N-terminal cleavage/methylation domain-containing protein [Lentisphaeria bacterium]